jgi:ATP-dependent DNA helicase RecG
VAQPPFDLTPCPGASLDDLDPAQVEAYRGQLERRNPGSRLIRQPLEELLLSVGALAKEGQRLQPTLAGILFFGRNPQHFYPSFAITFLHFVGTSTATARPQDPLYLDNRSSAGRRRP